MRQPIGQIGTQQAVADEDCRQNNDRPANGSTAGVEQSDDQNYGKDDLIIRDLAPAVIDGVEIDDVVPGGDDACGQYDKDPELL